VHLGQRAPDALGRGRDHLDVEAGARLEVVDDRRPGRIVHRHDQGLSDASDRHDQLFLGESRIDECPQRQVEHDRVEVEEVDVKLLAEGPPHLLLGHVAKAHDHFADRLLPAALLREGGLELFRGYRLGLDEELAEPRAAPVTVEDRQELAARDDLLGDEDLAQQHVFLRLALNP
jgi:hypothetical protein